MRFRVMYPMPHVHINFLHWKKKNLNISRPRYQSLPILRYKNGSHSTWKSVTHRSLSEIIRRLNHPISASFAPSSAILKDACILYCHYETRVWCTTIRNNSLQWRRNSDPRSEATSGRTSSTWPSDQKQMQWANKIQLWSWRSFFSLVSSYIFNRLKTDSGKLNQAVSTIIGIKISITLWTMVLRKGFTTLSTSKLFLAKM